MSAIDINASSTVCRKCGTAYSRLKGYFPISYGSLYKGTGYMPYCRDCVEEIYSLYLAECNDQKSAVRQTCRKLDVYWSDKLYESIDKVSASRSIMTNYIMKLNGPKNAGKSYDDTLREESALWIWPRSYADIPVKDNTEDNTQDDTEDDIEISDEVIAFWGPGNTQRMYYELSQRYDYWSEHLPAGVDINDIGVQALLRQICSVEIEINRERAAGKSTDKLVNTLNTLLGSAMLKPSSKKDETDVQVDNTPLGVWVKRWEDYRPVPDVDPEMRDVDGIIRYVTIWFLGHLCKMLGIKNTYCKLYEQEIAKLRVDRPEYEEEDDETLFDDIFGDGGEDEQV